MERDAWLSMGESRFEPEGCLEVTDIHVRQQTVDVLLSKGEQNKNLARDFLHTLYMWRPGFSRDDIAGMTADPTPEGRWIIHLSVRRAQFALVELLLKHNRVHKSEAGDEIIVECLDCGEYIAIKKDQIPRLPQFHSLFPQCEVPDGLQQKHEDSPVTDGSD